MKNAQKPTKQLNAAKEISYPIVSPANLYIILVAGIIYSIAMQMAVLLVPLYAITLQMPPLSLAFLISLPVILQLGIRVIGGIINNYFGEKRILMASFLAIALAGIVFMSSETLVYLYVAQILLSISRGLFWSTAQTYLSKLPEVKGRLNKVFGLFEGATAFGAILGLVMAGYLTQWFGFSMAFTCLVIIGTVSFCLCFILPDLTRSKSRETISAGFKNIGRVARHKPLYLAGICAFTAALPLSLVGSFYPVYLDSLGIQEGIIGVITSLKAVGTIFAGLVIARFLDRISLTISYTVSMVLVGVTLIITQMFEAAEILAVIIIFTGLGSGISSILFQSLTSKYSTEENRGSAMAFTTNFWTMSHLVTPILFGAITENLGLSYSFIIAGVAILLFGLMGTVAFRRFIPENYS